MGDDLCWRVQRNYHRLKGQRRNDVNYEILIQRVRTDLLQVVKEMSEIAQMMLMQQLMYLLRWNLSYLN